MALCSGYDILLVTPCSLTGVHKHNRGTCCHPLRDYSACEGWGSCRDSDSLQTRRCGDGIPMGARFSSSVQTGAGAHPASFMMGNWSLSQSKAPERGVNRTPTSSAEVKESVELNLLSFWAFMVCHRVNFAFFDLYQLAYIFGNNLKIKTNITLKYWYLPKQLHSMTTQMIARTFSFLILVSADLLVPSDLYKNICSVERWVWKL